MDNRALIERAKEVRAFSEHGSLAGKLADALERAEAELEKYRSAPVVAHQGRWTDSGASQWETVPHKYVDVRRDWPDYEIRELIIRPEAP